MSSSALFSIGTRAMTASYAALQTTGNNIANASTRGYSRQQVELATAGGQFSGNGFFGKGVDVTTVSRAHNQFLTREVALMQSVAAADGTRLAQLRQLEAVFGSGESGLGYRAGQLINAFVDVAARPQDIAARQVALARAQELAAQFRGSGERLDALQAGVVQDVRSAVAAVNALAQTVASLNRQIAAAKASGHEPNDLLDQRDTAIADIGSYLQVSSLEADDGQVSLFIGGGQRLVLGEDASTLAAMADPLDPMRVRVGLREGNADRVIPDSMLTGGAVAGMLRFQNEDLRDARNSLGQLAAALAGALNTQQHLGLDLTTPTGRPGSDLFATGAPRLLASRNNTGTATFSAAASDARALQASDYELRFDGANYTLTRQGSGAAAQTFTPAALAAGVVVDGVAIRLDAGTAAAGDRFLLQPVAFAASAMNCVLADPRGIAAASPVTATPVSTNTGTLSIAALQVKAPIPAPENVVVRFSQDPLTSANSYQISVDNGATFGAAQPLVAGTPIALVDAGGTVLWELSVNGTPADGDLLRVDPTPLPASNNGNALALAALGDAAMVGSLTLDEAWGSALADIGLRVQGAQGAADWSSTAATDAQARNSQASGVNLDEEAARLIQYQQSYQAAAKMLQIAQSVFDTLLQTTG